MSIPEYNLCAEDHRAVLVVVKRIGDKISLKSFNKIYSKISQVQYLKLSESNTTRHICIRYEKNYSPENNDWGDFQTYRKVLGLISVGKSSSDNVEQLCQEHINICGKYNNSAFDSRCLIFNDDVCSPSDADEVCTLEEKFLDDSSVTLSYDAKNVFKGSIEPVPKSHMVNGDNNLFNCTPLHHDPIDDLTNKSEVYNELCSLQDDSINIEISRFSQEDFCKSIKTSNLEVITTPPLENISALQIERDIVSNDKFSLSSSKKIIVSSLTNTFSTHCIIYPSTDNCEEIQQDVQEFINSIFWILESKRLDKSFEKQEKMPLLTAPFEKKNFIGIDTDTKVYKKRCLGRMKKHIGDLALQAGLPLEAFNLYVLSVEHLKSAQDWLWLASALEGQCSACVILLFSSECNVPPFKRNASVSLDMNSDKTKKSAVLSKSLPFVLDSCEYKQQGKNILSVNNIIEKYQEAISHYQKFQGAAVVEIECSIKSARVFGLFQKYLHASDILQNVIFTSLLQTDQEKLHRFNALAEIYSSIGFQRKASFFKRIAAMRCVSALNDDKNWNQCYRLLLDSLDGYCLPLDVKEFPSDIPFGWPGIQLQILLDLVGVSKQINNQSIAVRHMTYLLHTLLGFLNSSSQQEVCNQLELLTSKCEGIPIPLSLGNGFVIPPVNLINLPLVKSLKIQNLAPHLRPVKIASTELTTNYEKTDSIFIFSPIPKEKSLKDSFKIDFQWVAGDVCEVALQVFNPLPFELKVTDMSLLADGVLFESLPACFSLPPESGPYPVNLLGTPLHSGELQVFGYTTHVLGVKSNSHLIDISAIRKPFFSIDVIPKLPQIQVSSSLPKASTFSSLGDTSFVVISAIATLYAGERQECTITITNTGTNLVEWIDISLHSKLKKDIESVFFSWKKDDLNAQLPLHEEDSCTFVLNINAVGDFINTVNTRNSIYETVDDSNLEDIKSLHSSANNTPIRNRMPISNSELFPSKVIEAVLQIQYSGGSGMEAGYCRRCAVALTVEILPSVIIKKWDALPSEMSTHCYLVLDIQNATACEMEVLYSSNKRILIEAHDVCRIPVSVERCPLSIVSNFNDVWDSIDICHHTKKNTTSTTEGKKKHLLKACRDHLIKLVDLQWQLSALDISGQASISEIKWSDDMLGFILMSPIQWDIIVNRKNFKSESDFSTPVGDPITISIKLLNVSDVSLLDLHLYVRGYQDHQNGNQNYHLDTKRAVIGREKLLIDKINPQEELKHECSFVFFHSGMYKVDILCSHYNVKPHYSSSLLSESDSQNRNNFSVYQNTACLIQKCSPSIDIVVFED